MLAKANPLTLRSLGEMMLDSSLYEEGAFVDFFKGIRLRIANSDPTEGLLNFDMNSTFSRLRLYYKNITTEPDTVHTVYDFLVAGTTTPRHIFLDHDFSTGLVNDYFEDQERGDSLIFLQAMAGPNVEIEIPHLLDLGDVVINNRALG